MSMARHSIPDASLLQDRHTHRQLTGLQNIWMDKLIDRPPVASLLVPKGSLGRILDRDKCGLVRRMSRRAHHIELSRVSLVVAGKQNLLRSHGNIQTVLVPQRKKPHHPP